MKIFFVAICCTLFAMIVKGQDYSESQIFDGYTNQQIGTSYGDLGIVYGYVKEIIETRTGRIENAGRKYIYSKRHPLYIDTFKFLPNGHLIDSGLRYYFKNKLSFKAKFFDKYDLEEQKKLPDLDTNKISLVDRFDASGNKAGERYLKNGNLLYRTEIKENLKNKTTTYRVYNSTNTIELKQVSIYGNNEMLRYVIDYNAKNKMIETVAIVYKNLDKKGNWTERVETRKLPNGRITGTITTIRRIAYY